MQEILQQKLLAYIIDHNPDLLLRLQEENRLTQYLQEKVATVAGDIDRMQQDGAPVYIIEEIALDMLTADLKPSLFNYICEILNENFEALYYQWRDSSVLTYEVMNILNACASLFETVPFTAASENNPAIAAEVKAAIQQYISVK